MYAFTYERPTSLADAQKLSAGGAQLLAGGQTLLASMRLRLAAPEQLVDLSGVAELREIRRDGDAVVIGAMARHVDVANNADVLQTVPSLADLASHIGDRQVRARGTIGGSVANNDPAACYPCGVLALNAIIKTTSREIAADDFFLGMFATALEPGELITSFRFAACKRGAYVRQRQQASRFALVGVFVADTKDGVRVAVTGAGTGVFRHPGLEVALSKNFAPEAVAGVKIDATDLNSDIHASAEYRANLIGVLTQRAVRHAMG